MRHRSCRRILLPLLAVLATITMVGIPLGATEVGATPTDQWSASGPGSVDLAGNGLNGDPAFTYFYCSTPGETTSDCVGDGVPEQTWTFEATAQSTESPSATYAWDGFHAYNDVTADLSAFVQSPGGSPVTTTLVSAGPDSCCTTPSAGFDYTGSYTFSGLSAGDTYGFYVSGSNFDSNSQLNGTFTYETLGGAPPLPPTSLTATAATTGALNLSWTELSANGFGAPSSYQVLVGTSSGGESLDSYATITGTSASVSAAPNGSPLADGTTYYVTVAAVNSFGTSAPSNEASATSTVFVPPDGAPTWTELDPATTPGPQETGAMAYDSATGQVVLFDAEGSTWTWNGSDWTEQHPATSPPARSGAAMADDPATGQVVLFGGFGGGGDLDDTWGWTGTNWVNETPATPGEGPTAVQGASMAYDGATNQLILLDGGVSTEQVNQMWTWNGSIWAQLSGTMPPARDDASLAYDQATGQLVLFGGTDFSNDELSDTWVWGGTTPGWTSESRASSPSGRSDAVMADDPSSGNLLLFGGYNGSSSNLGDTWEWTGSNWVQPGPAASPLSRTAAMGASDPSTGQVVLYGGVHSSVLSDTWVWGYPDTWAQAGTASAPPARSDAAMAYDAGTGQLVLFGGQGSGGTALDDTWVWNGSDWSQVSTSPSLTPPARWGAVMAYDASTGQLVLFGGYTGAVNGYLGDTWTWNGSGWTSSASSGPPARVYASMAYDASSPQELVLFGGYGASGWDDDTWTWTSSGWQVQTPGTSPPNRELASMAYDASSGSVVLFGGYTQNPGNTYYADTWEWNGATGTWTGDSPATSPSERDDAAMAADDLTGGVLLSGGQLGTALSDTWAWDGASTGWVAQQPTSSAPANSGGRMADDDASGQLLLFGGDNASAAPTSVTSLWATPPGAPAGVSAVPASQSAVLTWNASSFDGGAPVVDYEVFERPSGGAAPSTLVATEPAGTTSATVGNLTDGDGYAFTVVAQSAAGTGVPSTEVSATPVAPTSVPGAPSALTAAAGAGQVALSWNAPSSSGGSQLLGYYLYEGTSPGGEAPEAVGYVGAATTTDTISGLTNGTEYYFTVAAVNAVGSSTTSSNEASATPLSTPSVPLDLVATPSASSIQLTWGPPSSNGGSAVTGYDVWQSSTAGVPTGAPTAQVTSPGYSSGTLAAGTYYFTVEAVNPAGAGAYAQVSASPGPSSVSVSVSPASPTLSAAQSLPSSDVPPSALSGPTGATGASSSSGSGSGGTGAAALSSIPLSNVALSSIALSSIALSSIALSSIPLPQTAALASSSDAGLAAAGSALGDVALSNLSITYSGCPSGTTETAPCSGWAGVLEGTPLASAPLDDVTLAQVLTDTTPGSGQSLSPSAKFESLDLGDLGVASSALSSIPLSAIALSSISLSSIPLAGSPAGATAGQVLTQWCTTLADLASNPYDCAQFGITNPSSGSDNGVTLLDLALAGVPVQSIALSSIALSSIALDNTALSSIALSSIPLQDTALSSIALSSIALSSIPIGNVALSSIALSSIPIGNVALSSIALSSIALSSIPIFNVALSSIALSSIALSSIALSSIDLQDTALSSIALSSIALSSIPLGNVALSSIALSSIPLGNVALSSVALSSIETVVDCAALSGDCTSGTLAQAEADGDLLPGVTLEDLVNVLVATGDTSAVGSTTLGELGYYGSTNLAQLIAAVSGSGESAVADTTLADLGSYGRITLGELVTAIEQASDPVAQADLASTTLADLGPGNVGSTTLGQLIAELISPSGAAGYECSGGVVTSTCTSLAQVIQGVPGLTLSELLGALEPPQSYSWPNIALADVPVAADASGGGTETLNSTVTVTGAGGQVQLTATLPAGFAYVPGSSRLDATSVGDPSAGSTSSTSGQLDWSLSIGTGTHDFSFEARAGDGIGEVSAGVSASLSGQSAGPSSSTTSFQVADGEQPAINSTSTAPQLSSGTLSFGYITSSSDVDYWKVQVAQGQELSLALTNLPANYDLVLYQPTAQASTQLQGSPSQQVAPVDDTLPSLNLASTVEAPPGAQDIPVAPPSGYQLYEVANDGGVPQDVADDAGTQYIQTTPLDAGTYIVQVSGYDGATSPQPYLLQAQLLGSGVTEGCQAPAFTSPSPQASEPTPATPSIPSGTNTLFLLDSQRLAAAYGASGPGSEATILSALQPFLTSNGGVDGVDGALVTVDSYAAVQQAYTNWDNNPCSVADANAVVTAIDQVIDTIRSSDPAITSIVLVGADDQIPFARLPDGAVDANERDYAAGTFAGELNEESEALAEGYYFSDDPYAASEQSSLGVGAETLYLPTAAIGRLVETPAEIATTLGRFVSSNGTINTTAGLSTGYSFLASGADLVSANLQADGLKTVTNLIDTTSTAAANTWTAAELEADLDASPGSGVESVNAHFDFSRALSSYGEANDDDNDLFQTSNVALPTSSTQSPYFGKLLFSMGCHAGLDVDALEVAPSGVSGVSDWAQTFAQAGALWVANTGYGYADNTPGDVAYSAALMADFAGDLGQNLTIGQALAEAEQQYAAGNAVLSPYDVKAIMESTFYGLPMYTLGTSASTSGSTPTPPATTLDPITGLTVAPVSITLPSGSAAGDLQEESGAGGTSYFQVNGSNADNGSTQTTEFRPVEPLATLNVTEPSASNPSALGLVAHGALIDALTSSDHTGFDPTISEPEPDTSASPVQVGTSAFPDELQRIADYQTFISGGSASNQQLDVVAGQFLPNPSTPGQGTERVFSKIGAEVLYTTPSASLAGDLTPPTIETSDATAENGATDFAVTVAPGESAAPVERVLVLYTAAANPGTWTALDLAPDSGRTDWSGAAATAPSGGMTYFVEAVDAAGNVAMSSNNGTDFGSSSAPPTSSPSIVVSLQGTTASNGDYLTTVTLEVSVSPAGGAAAYSLDGAAPVALPANGQISVSSDGPHTVVVSDAAGNQTTSSFDIDVNGPSISALTAPAAVNRWVPGAWSATNGSAASAGSTLEVAATDNGAPLSSLSWSATGTKQGASTSGSTSGSTLALPLTANGTTTFSLTAVDQAGRTSTTTVVVHVDAAAPSVTCKPPASSGWVVQNVSVPCTVTDSESGIAAQPALFSSYTSSSASFTLSTSVAAGQASSTASTPSATVCSALGDCTTVGPFGPYEVDRSALVVSITTPSSGADYTIGQKVTASYSCSDTGPGVKTCSGTVANGALISTASAGTFSFTVTATDKAGSTTTATVSYDVSYAICEVPPTQVQQTVVFLIALCNAAGQDLTSLQSKLTAVSVDGTTTPVPALPDPGNLFVFIPLINIETYLLSTTKLAAGSHTLQISVAGDPVAHSIAFTVKQ